ncbi:MAG: thiamine ABC transporter substrate-binding protein [Actinobacteria bacterium]|nr:thiamine ABC transporter substrate-binding protein [Actinomycetota bacterium]
MKLILLLVLLTGSLTACGDNENASEGTAGDEGGGETTVTLVTHDSFAATESVLEAFTEETGVTIEILPSGDAGEMVNKSVLTAGEPLGDVLFGVDNTFLSRALEADLFVPYESPALAAVPDELELDAEHRVTPVDHGEVCVNFDKAAFDSTNPPPSELADLTEAAYRDQFVVQNPATSSPGLAFLLATIEKFGEDGWEDYWRGLKDNGVQITSGWEEAYNDAFSGGAGEGNRPLVVSYASSPPAEVHFSETPEAEATTGVVEDGCFRQIEFAGILRGSEDVEASQQVVDFLLSEEFQADMPLNMFVFPAREGVELPDVFERFAAQPADPVQMDPERITEGRDRWVARWTELMLG